VNLPCISLLKFLLGKVYPEFLSSRATVPFLLQCKAL
jgi:hypothetical protein